MRCEMPEKGVSDAHHVICKRNTLNNGLPALEALESMAFDSFL
jgi:hypothetical protein